MEDPTGTSRPGLSIHEAAVLLGVSPNTVRRRVAAGSLRSERIPRPQGEVIRVYLDRASEVPKQVPPEVVPGDVPNEVPLTYQMQVPDIVRAEAMASLISASIAPVLAPLVAQLEADRQAIERQGETIRDQAERLGRQATELERAASIAVELGDELEIVKAENRALVARTEARSVEPTTESPPLRSSSTTWLTPQRFWLIAALVLVLIGVGVVQVVVALYSLAVQLAMPG